MSHRLLGLSSSSSSFRAFFPNFIIKRYIRRYVFQQYNHCWYSRFYIRSTTLSTSKILSPLSKDFSTLKSSKLDPITRHRLESAQRAYYKRRMMYSTIGVLCGMVGLYLTAIQAPLPPQTPIAGSSQKIICLDSGRKPDDDSIINLGKERKVIVTQREKIGEDVAFEKERANDFVNTGNSVVPEFPRFLKINQNNTSSSSSSNSEDLTEYQLLGLGIRTVSFLKIQVYVVGIYIASDDIQELQNQLIKRINSQTSILSAEEKDELKNVLRDPEKSEQIWDSVLLDGACRMSIRIVPTRNTDFGHLRDAWVRSMTSRAQKVSWNDEKFGESLADFKRIFARGNVPKGTEIILSKGKQGNLEIWSGGEKAERYKLGELWDERVSRAVWLGYLAGKDVACEGARDGVVTGLLKFMERPIGTGLGQK